MSNLIVKAVMVILVSGGVALAGWVGPSIAQADTSTGNTFGGETNEQRKAWCEHMGGYYSFDGTDAAGNKYYSCRAHLPQAGNGTATFKIPPPPPH